MLQHHNINVCKTEKWHNNAAYDYDVILRLQTLRWRKIGYMASTAHGITSAVVTNHMGTMCLDIANNQQVFTSTYWRSDDLDDLSSTDVTTLLYLLCPFTSTSSCGTLKCKYKSVLVKKILYIRCCISDFCTNPHWLYTLWWHQWQQLVIDVIVWIITCYRQL